MGNGATPEVSCHPFPSLKIKENNMKQINVSVYFSNKLTMSTGVLLTVLEQPSLFLLSQFQLLLLIDQRKKK